jgi:hypothetical protein
MDDEDFFIDDVLNTLKTKKKKVNSKDKGQRGERDLCKVLADRFPTHTGFFRVVGSGNRWSHAELTEQAKSVMTGDLVCPEGFAFTIECKYGYADIDLCYAFEGGHKEIDKFLEQADKDADRVSKKPMLCWKKPRQPWLAFLKNMDVDTDYKMYYRNWVVVSLADILRTQPDEFFFQSGPS